MNKRTYTFLLLALACTLAAHAQDAQPLLCGTYTRQQVAQWLMADGKWAPWPAYDDRDGWRRLTGDFRESCIAAGESLMDYQWQLLPATSYLEFERSGNRLVNENPFFANLGALSTLLFAELAEGQGRFLDQLVNGIWWACETTTWSLSAHVMQQQPSGRSVPEQGIDVFDLGAGWMANVLSLTYHFLRQPLADISPEVPRRLHAELQRRILTPFLNGMQCWWKQRTNNWNPWCSSNLLLTALLTEPSGDRLTECVWQSMQCIDRFMAGQPGDGGCDEGPSYWGHAAGKLLDYLELLRMATGGRIDVYDNPMVKAMGEYLTYTFVGDGWVVNFSDASARNEGDCYTIFRYGSSVNSPRMTALAATLFQQQADCPPTLTGHDAYRNLLTLSAHPELKKAQPGMQQSPFAWYPKVGHCFMQRSGIFLAAKGGHNAESHNHNDVGTASVWIDRVPVLIDLGVETYTRQTFSPERYSIWTMQSAYHNLPAPNGTQQQAGREHRATAVTASPGRFSADIAGAYPPEANVSQWVRSYRLTDGGVQISDNYTLTATTAPNQVSFMTWQDATETRPGELRLSGHGISARLTYDPAQLQVDIQRLPVHDAQLQQSWGTAVTRLHFTARRLRTRGTYRFNLQRE